MVSLYINLVIYFNCTHYWHFIPLSQMPKIEFCSNAKPSVYAYPELLQPPKKEEKEKVSTAILSITAKAKARQKKTNQEEAMEVVSIAECFQKTKNI